MLKFAFPTGGILVMSILFLEVKDYIKTRFHFVNDFVDLTSGAELWLPWMYLVLVVFLIALGVYKIKGRLTDMVMMSMIYDSIGAFPPESPLDDSDRCALFRHLPFLASKIPWTPLGEYPTPVHIGRLANVKEGKKVSKIFIKREDLSSQFYGGNKVRALEYQLAACKAHKNKQPEARFFSLGMSGSNQTVATLVHGRRLGLDVEPCLIDQDTPDLDNTLNFLSLLSFQPAGIYLWTACDKITQLIWDAVIWGKNKIFAIGGNNLLGVLGQMGGILELAEQIQLGELDDIDVLYVAMGSSCTLIGHVLGVCLARYLKLDAFKAPAFKIVVIPILPNLAIGHRERGLFYSFWSRYQPLLPRYGFRRVSAFIQRCGLSVNLEPLAVDFLLHHVEFETDPTYVGPCGSHCELSLAAATKFESTIEIEGVVPNWLKKSKVVESANELKPWLCGHFTGKIFAKLIHDIVEEPLEEKPKVRLLWQTKSWLQPRGPVDEWNKIVEMTKASKELKEWVCEGQSYSRLRIGQVSVPNGKAQDYRHLMTSVNLS